MEKFLKYALSLVIFLMIIVVIAGVYKFNFTDGGDIMPITNATSTTVVSNADVKNISYVIDGVTFDLVNGKVEKEIAPGSASKQTVSIFGEPVYSDLNGDGIKDSAITRFPVVSATGAL